MTPAEQLTEQRIAAALAARAGGITMGTSTLEERFTELQERGRRQDARRRRFAAGGAALAAAAAALAVVLGAGALTQDEVAAPPASEAPAVEQLVGSGRLQQEATRYGVQQPVPLSFELPRKGDVDGRWGYGTGDGGFSVGLEASRSTGHASVTVERVEQVYDPTVPAAGQTSLQPAPTDGDGWIAWFESTGVATVSGRSELQVDGRPATRFTVTIDDQLPATALQCGPGEPCLALRPLDPATPGKGPQAGFPAGWFAEVTVVGAGEDSLLAVASGDPASQAWQPLMRSLVDSLRFG